MRKKRIVALGLIAILTVTNIVGCGKASSSDSESSNGTKAENQPTVEAETKEPENENSVTPETGEKVTLNYFAWNEGDYLQDIVDAYNAQNNGVEVKLTVVAGSDYDDKLVTMLAGSNDIDLYSMRSIAQLSQMASTGNLENITDLIQEKGVDVSAYGNGFADSEIDGKFYALPYRAQSYALFYNKKVFEEQNVPYPENITWEEYAEIAKQLTGEFDGKKVYGGYLPEWLFAPFMTRQMRAGIEDDDLTATRAWLEQLNRFYNVDKSHLSYSEMVSTGADYLTYLCSGQAAMLPNGDWCVSDINKLLESDPSLNDTFEMGIALLPQLSEDSDPLTLGGVSTFIGINASTSHVEEAFDFTCYLAGEEGEKIIASYGMLPAYVSDSIIDTYKEVVGEGAEYLLDVDKISEGASFNKFNELQSIYMEERELYLIGEQTIDDTIDNFTERRAELLGK